MNDMLLTLYNILSGSVDDLAACIFLVVYIVCCIRMKISGQQTARVGFVVFFVMIIAVLVRQSFLAEVLGQYVFLLFVISFIQEFYHFLKHENK